MSITYECQVLGDGGSANKQKLYVIQSGSPIDEKLLQVAAFILDGGLGPEDLEALLPSAAAYTQVKEEPLAGLQTGPLLRVLDCLNSAYKADPAAMHALVANRIPCNLNLSNHKFIIADQPDSMPADQYFVGALGIVNGVLNVLGLPRVAARLKDSDRSVLGFCEYRPPAVPQDPSTEGEPVPVAQSPERHHREYGAKAALEPFWYQIHNECQLFLKPIADEVRKGFAGTVTEFGYTTGPEFYLFSYCRLTLGSVEVLFGTTFFPAVRGIAGVELKTESWQITLTTKELVTVRPVEVALERQPIIHALMAQLSLLSIPTLRRALTQT